MNELTEEEKEAKYGELCPVCKTPWTKTPRVVTSDRWWHCEKCAKKASTIAKQESNKKEKSSVNPVDNSEWYNSNKGWF